MKQSLCAAFTMSRDEPLWLPAWLDHHGWELGDENLWVICEPDDPVIDDCAKLFPLVHFVVEPSGKRSMTDGHYDMALELWRLEVVKRWQENLLQHYSCVIFSDTDEFLVPSRGLLRYCEEEVGPRDRVRSECWGVVQDPDTLERRMWRTPNYDKTLLVRTPQHYARGFHYTYGLDGAGCQLTSGLKKRINDPVDPSLPMVHCDRADFQDWMRHGPWRYRITEDQAKQYFRDHVPAWGSHSKCDVEGEPKEVPQDWRVWVKR